ncbi:hypothetical protein L1049_018434 [Liquidambar formosana]|uniref:DUF1677 family protein n=1 Tax=Liquidambar formosana TaxID=63359 RepID=A0AAP0WM88_LIQFO
MAAAIFNETKAISGVDSQTPAIIQGPQLEVEFAKCDGCGLTEECTPAYISRVRERYQGRWVCGLCAEAIKDEIVRSERLISAEEALNRHMKFCEQFRSATPPLNPTEELIIAMKQLVLRSLDSPRAVRSPLGSPMRKGGSVCGSTSFVRSKSCFSTIDD